MIKIYNRDNLSYGYCHGYDSLNESDVLYKEIELVIVPHNTKIQDFIDSV